MVNKNGQRPDYITDEDGNVLRRRYSDEEEEPIEMEADEGETIARIFIEVHVKMHKVMGA